MRIPFRQGIVQYNHPLFVQINFPYVDLVASTNSPLILNIASSTSDYLQVEKSNITNAWGPITANTDVWLYVDIDRYTAVRTFGTTYVLPTFGATVPAVPQTDQHWFDTTTNEMKVWNGTNWVVKIRVFACMLQSGAIPVSMSINSPTSFDGTQIGNITSVLSGYILFDADNNPMRSVDGQFTTSETIIRVNSSTANDVKIASMVVEAVALVNFPAFTIVEFAGFGKVQPASAFVTQIKKQYGIVQQDVHTGDIVNVGVDGVFTNLDWDWTSAGVNAYLYNDSNGVISATPSIPEQQPVAIVVDTHTIMLVTKVIVTNLPPTLAGNTNFGIVSLSVPATDTANPIAVGDNDSRMTNARTPLAHVHPISDVTNLQTSLDAKLTLTGGTMSGNLILNGDPTIALGAATKQYVDNALLGLFWQAPILDPDLKDDSLNVPPVSPGEETYIVGPTPTGAWTGLSGHVVRWDLTAWVDVLGRPVAAGDRFGIGMEYGGIPGGGLTGYIKYIAQVVTNVPGSITYTFTAPTQGDAVLVNASGSSHFGHQYTYNGTSWVELSGHISLAQLTDVTLTTPVAGQALTFNGTTWINSTPASSLSMLTDVTLTAPISGQVLTFNGTNWINSTAVTSVNLSGGTTGLIATGGPITSTGTITLGGTLGIASGGTGQTTAANAFNALVPTQTGNTGRYLTTNGTNTSWGTITFNTLAPSQTGQAGKYLTTDGTNVSWAAVVSGGGGSASFPSSGGIANKVLITTDGVNTAWLPISNIPTLAYSIFGCGSNSFGQIGDETTIRKSSPVQVGTLTDWMELSQGDGSTAAIKNNGTLWTWGYNSQGQLGDGTIVDKSSPVQVGALTNWSSVDFGGTHFTAIKTDGTLWSCGYNVYGQLGDGTRVKKSSPIQVGSLTTWNQSASGWDCTAAIKTDGTLWMCGYNVYGQLGDGTRVSKSSMIQVGTLTNWKQISCGSDYSMAVKTDGTLWAWGINNVGQLGDGTTANKSSPVQIGALNTWKQVFCGGNHAAMLKTDGTLWACGYNTNGQLGDGTNITKSSPVQIGNLATWAQVSCGSTHTAAIKKDGTLWVCGYNGQGQLGQGPLADGYGAGQYSSLIQVGSQTYWTQVSCQGSNTGLLANSSSNTYVSSVGVSGGTTGLTTSGSPVTSIGTITIAGTLNVTNGGTGLTTLGTGLQVLRTNATATAMEWGDVGSVTSVSGSGGTTGLTLIGGPITTTGTLTLGGTLGFNNGGTGLTVVGNGLQVLRTNATMTALEWATSGTVTSVALSGGTTGLTFSGGPITTNGTITLAGTLGFANGGTGQTTANTALNAMLPTQTGNAGNVLTTNGTNTSWTPPAGRISNVAYSPIVSLNWTNLDIIRITLTGNITITNQLAAFDGQRAILELTQDGIGNRTVLFTSETIFGSDIVYTPSTLPNKTDVVGISYHQPTGKFRIVAVARGY